MQAWLASTVRAHGALIPRSSALLLGAPSPHPPFIEREGATGGGGAAAATSAPGPASPGAAGGLAAAMPGARAAAARAVADWALSQEERAAAARSAAGAEPFAARARAARAGGDVARALQSRHETLSLFVAPPQEGLLRWQRAVLLATSLLSALAVDVACHYSRGVRCCSTRRSALGCGGDPSSPCLSFSGTCSDLADQFASLMPSSDASCTAFPNPGSTRDKLLVGCLLAAVLVPLRYGVSACLKAANEPERPNAWLEASWRAKLGARLASGCAAGFSWRYGAPRFGAPPPSAPSPPPPSASFSLSGFEGDPPPLPERPPPFWVRYLVRHAFQTDLLVWAIDAAIEAIEAAVGRTEDEMEEAALAQAEAAVAHRSRCEQQELEDMQARRWDGAEEGDAETVPDAARRPAQPSRAAVLAAAAAAAAGDALNGVGGGGGGGSGAASTASPSLQLSRPPPGRLTAAVPRGAGLSSPRGGAAGAPTPGSTRLGGGGWQPPPLGAASPPDEPPPGDDPDADGRRGHAGARSPGSRRLRAPSPPAQLQPLAAASARLGAAASRVAGLAARASARLVGLDVSSSTAPRYVSFVGESEASAAAAGAGAEGDAPSGEGLPDSPAPRRLPTVRAAALLRRADLARAASRLSFGGGGAARAGGRTAAPSPAVAAAAAVFVAAGRAARKAALSRAKARVFMAICGRLCGAVWRLCPVGDSRLVRPRLRRRHLPRPRRRRGALLLRSLLCGAIMVKTEAIFLGAHAFSSHRRC